jgi:hypothetical protein
MIQLVLSVRFSMYGMQPLVSLLSLPHRGTGEAIKTETTQLLGKTARNTPPRCSTLTYYYSWAFSFSWLLLRSWVSLKDTAWRRKTCCGKGRFEKEENLQSSTNQPAHVASHGRTDQPSGCIKDAIGNAIGDLELCLKPHFYPGFTDSIDGCYNIDGVPPGEYQLAVEPAFGVFGYHTNITVTNEGKDLVLDIALPVPGSVSGCVRRRKGDAVGGVNVNLANIPNTYFVSKYTDGLDGCYIFEIVSPCEHALFSYEFRFQKIVTVTEEEDSVQNIVLPNLPVISLLPY